MKPLWLKSCWWKLSTGIDPSLYCLICLFWLAFSIAYSPSLPPPYTHTLSSTPVKTWKVINKCPLCCRTNTDGIWLTHGGLAEPWAGLGKQAATLQKAAGLRGCQNISAGQEHEKLSYIWWTHTEKERPTVFTVSHLGAVEKLMKQHCKLYHPSAHKAAKHICLLWLP